MAADIVAAFTLFIAVTFPFFGDLLGFLGGFGFTPTSYFVSCLHMPKMAKFLVSN